MKKFLIVMAVAALASVTLSAGTIQGADCLNNSCFGGIYTLDATYVSGTATTEMWRIEYKLDTRGIAESGVSYIGSIAAKVTSDKNAVATTVINPTSGGWSAPVPGNLNSNGCGGKGAGWFCIAWAGPANQLLTGAGADPSYSWVFNVQMKAGSFLNTASIKANFDPAEGKLMSENINVPEGSSPELPMVLSALGLWMFGRNRWKRRMAAQA